jgi:ABC-type antimicrobial peptide transport system permease subunit
MALGAERANVVRMVVREASGVVAAGEMLYGLPALDPVTFVGAVIVLVGVALIAAFVPARRAATADPMEALRVS